MSFIELEKNFGHDGKKIMEILDLFNSKYYCKICRQMLRTKADEIIHLKYKHNQQVDKNQCLKCLFCSSQFKTYLTFKKHLMIKHLDERPYGCKKCNNTKRFTQFVQLKMHVKKFHANNKLDQFISYTNSKFDMSIVNVLMVKEEKYDNFHLKQEIKQNEVIKIKNEQDDTVYQVNLKLNCLKCKLCSKICLTEANYLVHKWEHLINNNKAYLVCWQCKTLKFSSYYDLEIHLHTKHLNEFSYECNSCKQSFYDWNLMKVHLNKSHFNVQTIKFNCLNCNILFNSHKDVVYHTLRIHSNVDLNNDKNVILNNNFYKCISCDDKLISKVSLNLHLEQHEFISNNMNKQSIQDNKILPKTTSKRGIPLICDLCGYSFENAFFLNQHKSLHLSENLKRPHKCHLCQVMFSKGEQLLRHMIVHQANELDFVCKVCYSTFSRKQDLDRHMNFHVLNKK